MSRMRIFLILSLFMGLDTCIAVAGEETSSVSMPSVEGIVLECADNLGGDIKPTVEVCFSPTCGHCADYIKTMLPKIEEEFIKTGKIKVILRLFPFNNWDFVVGKLSLIPNPNGEGYALSPERIHLFLYNQEKWMPTRTEQGSDKKGDGDTPGQRELDLKIKETADRLGVPADDLKKDLCIEGGDPFVSLKLFCFEHKIPLDEILSAVKENPVLENALTSVFLQTLDEKGNPIQFAPAFFIDGKLQPDSVNIAEIKAFLKTLHKTTPAKAKD
ncbi:MAG: thioredoxin domain-containing protein [Alphaproteobacteria bacterium]|nr:thioredoxin domain-containing protein [Alphaproteobacteria bacterium]